MLRVGAHECPPSTRPVRQRRYGDKYHTQGQLIADGAISQKRCVRRLIDSEPRGRDQQEAPRRLPDPRTTVMEREPVVTEERHAEGDQPSERIGDQRSPAACFDKKDDDEKVHCGCRSADRDKPPESPECCVQGRRHAPMIFEQRA